VKTLDPVLSLKPFKESGPEDSSKRIFCCKGESLPNKVWSKTTLLYTVSKNHSPTERLNFFRSRAKSLQKTAAAEYPYMPRKLFSRWKNFYCSRPKKTKAGKNSSLITIN